MIGINVVELVYYPIMRACSALPASRDLSLVIISTILQPGYMHVHLPNTTNKGRFNTTDIRVASWKGASAKLSICAGCFRSVQESGAHKIHKTKLLPSVKSCKKPFTQAHELLASLIRALLITKKD